MRVKEGTIVYIRYLDHVLFRNVNSSLYKPAERETVGWLVKGNDKAVWILWDRSLNRLPQERTKPEESGLVLLKSGILELKLLE